MNSSKMTLLGFFLVAVLATFFIWKKNRALHFQDPWEVQRSAMVREQLSARGIRDEKVLAAMLRVPRHLFVPYEIRQDAYADTALPIGLDQTISQPYVVAAMTELLHLTGKESVLEVGTGSGYQAAVLGDLAAQVYSIEILPELSERAGAVLRKLNYFNVKLKTGDGWRGWPQFAPYDAIIVTAAPETVPPMLVQQLKEGGRLIIPLGGRDDQELVCFTKSGSELQKETAFPVRFVPLVKEPHGP